MEGLCPVCGWDLEHWERRPAGKATRSLCKEDYERLIARTVNYDCFVCGSPLESPKVSAQRRDLREVQNHIHDGQCNNTWTLIHNVSVGEPEVMKALGLDTDLSEVTVPHDQHRESLLLIAVKRSPEPLPLAHGSRQGFPRALPAPAERIPILLEKIHKGKPVRVLS